MSKPFSIKQWNEDDRPREKMMIKGRTSLSDAELIAILIGSGNKDDSAVALAKKMLAFTNNNLNAFSKLSFKNLMEFRGIGKAKAISIIAALELAKRCKLEKALNVRKITNSKLVYEIMQPIIGDLNHEEFWVIYLNNSNKIIYRKQLSKGGVTGTIVDTRLVFNKAIELLATGIILCHNHPSGSLKPSGADKKLTIKMKQAGETLDIKVLDHLIITEKGYFSFADSNLL